VWNVWYWQLFQPSLIFHGKAKSKRIECRACKELHSEPHDTQHNDNLQNDIQHNDIQYYNIQRDDIQHNDSQHNEN
jgi:hypothetical protein